MPEAVSSLAEAEGRVNSVTEAAAQLLAWLLLALVPRFLLEGVVQSARVPMVAKWSFVLAFVALQLFFALSIATGRRRKIVLTKLHSTSVVAPLGYSLGLAIFSIGVYTAMMSLLNANGAAGLVESRGVLDFSFSRLQDLFLWHLLAAIPVVDLNDAFLFEKPFTYSAVWAGLLLLLFKVVVIGPVVGALTVWWKLMMRKRQVRAA